MNIINVSGDLLGFIAELTSLTSKHTSFECQIAVNESEKVVFKPVQTALCPLEQLISANERTETKSRP